MVILELLYEVSAEFKQLGNRHVGLACELSEDVVNEMQYVLSEAIEAEKPIRITVFEPSRDTNLVGVPMILGGTLRI